MKKLTKIVLGLGIPIALNLGSFSGVAMQKYIGKRTAEQAAVESYVSYGKLASLSGVLYGAGLKLGHETFYNQDYEEVARNQLRK